MLNLPLINCCICDKNLREHRDITFSWATEEIAFPNLQTHMLIKQTVSRDKIIALYGIVMLLVC